MDTPTQISFDNYNLQDDTIIIDTLVGDDSAPEKAYGLYELPVIAGAKKTFEKYQARKITIGGMIKSATASGLIAKIEELKEVATRQDKSLQFTYQPGGYTRIFTASVIEAPKVERPAYAINIAQFTMTFLCVEPWSTQTLATTSGVYTISSNITSLALGISGLFSPQPIIYFNPTVSGSKFLIMNGTTGDSMEVATSISGLGQLRIDTNNFTVKLNGDDVDYKGVFPRFNPGVNNLSVVTIGAAGNAVDQKFDDAALLDGADYAWFGGATSNAQSFVPAVAKLVYLELYLAYGSGTYGDITVQIRSDNSGVPSSTVLGTATISAFNSATPAWKRAILSSTLTLTPGTTYWIVLSSATSGSAYTYGWAVYNTSSQYSSGKAMQSVGGITWFNYASSVSDFFFRTVADYGSMLTGKLIIEYTPRRL